MIPAGATSRIQLHPLRTRADHGQWCVGRTETGEFVLLPDIAIHALRLLDQAVPVGEVRDALKREHGRDIDVIGFVNNLIGLGFVARVDGSPVDTADPPRSTWPWLRPKQVGWALSPVLPVVIGCLVACAVTVVAFVPAALPTYRDLLWSRQGTVVLVTNAVVGWSLLFLHELGHLVTARAAGLPGRITFTTRLQFLSVQTDVSGAWGESRRVRLTIYLAGIAVDAAIAAVAVIVRSGVGATTTAGRLLGAVAVLAVFAVPIQFLIFMRTDIYFVIQDLTGCHDLYGDGSAYTRYLARRLRSLVRPRRDPGRDPSTGLPATERRVIRAYTPLLVIGTALCLWYAVVFTLPVVAALVGQAGGRLRDGHPSERVDGVITLLLLGGMVCLWCHAWWRRHHRKLVGWTRGLPAKPRESGRR